ncbi:hypothetical protein BDY24DRAFT_416785 [Mrakia frigida]|uniref:uncharacterized protein n=1 Tax=Mrakia frigida TaxID=29902 RepID=UPI003FCBEEFA
MSQPDASSSSSKKRKTVESSTSDEPSSSSSTTYSEDFNDPEGDVVLQSSNNVLFRVQRFYLQAASTVFRDMLAIPQPPSNGSSLYPPIVKIEESSEHLTLLLRQMQPDRFKEILRWEDLLVGLDLADKYEVTLLSFFISKTYLADADAAFFGDLLNNREDDKTCPSPTPIDLWALARQHGHVQDKPTISSSETP